MKFITTSILFILSFTSLSQEIYVKNLQQTEDRFYTDFVIKMAEGFSNGYEFYAKNYFKIDEIKKIIKNKKELSEFSTLIEKYKIKKFPRPKVTKEGIELDVNGKKMLITVEGYLRGYFELDGKKIAIYDKNFNIKKSIQLIERSVVNRKVTFSKLLNFIISSANAKDEVTEERVIMALVAEIQLKWLFPDDNDSEFVDVLPNEMASNDNLTGAEATYYLDNTTARWRDRVMRNINEVYKTSRKALEHCKKTQEFIENGVTADNLDNYLREKYELEETDAASRIVLSHTRNTDRFVNFWLYNLGWENYEDREHMEKQKSYINALMRKFLFLKFDKSEEGLTCRSGLEKTLYVETNRFITPVVAQDMVHRRYEVTNMDHENPCQTIRELTKCLSEIDQKDKRRVLEELSRRAGKELLRYRNVPDDKKQHPGWGQERD